jgi:phytol kinase
MAMVASAEILVNAGWLGLCYIYIIGIILLTGSLSSRLPLSVSRKFLHIMIGNLVFIIPFFSLNSFPLNFPFFVAAPFVALTLLFSPLAPITLSDRVSRLADVTGGGHKYGLVFYAISYTVLAFLFSSQPYVIAVGILPMAFGDAAASLVGQKLGKHRYGRFGKKSVEGSAAMFCVSFMSLSLSIFFFSIFQALPVVTYVFAALAASVVAAVCEAFTSKGFDNLTVPLFSTLVFLVLAGGL